MARSLRSERRGGARRSTYLVRVEWTVEGVGKIDLYSPEPEREKLAEPSRPRWAMRELTRAWRRSEGLVSLELVVELHLNRDM